MQVVQGYSETVQQGATYIRAQERQILPLFAAVGIGAGVVHRAGSQLHGAVGWFFVQKNIKAWPFCCRRQCSVLRRVTLSGIVFTNSNNTNRKLERFSNWLEVKTLMTKIISFSVTPFSSKQHSTRSWSLLLFLQGLFSL